jgi:hypothetical protein
MIDAHLCPWSQAVHLHPDVEAGDTAVATYAIDLGALVAGDKNVPQVYRRPDAFFAATHLTSGLRRLLEDVLGGLAGGKGDRVLQLRSPFGGGKSHTLAALYHAAQDRAALGDAFPDVSLPDPGAVRVAVFDGEKFDVLGREIKGQHVRTMWGMLAAQLDCSDLVAYHDQNRVSPGGDVIAKVLGDTPTLFLLDEVLKYLERVSAEPVGDSTLGRLTQDFLQSLSVEVAGASYAVLVYSLQASAHEAYGHEALLNMLDHLTSRVDAKREPVVGDEVLPVLRRRLLAGLPDSDAAKVAAETFAAQITHMRAAHATDVADQTAAEDDRLVLQDRIVAAYPFHPALIDIMTERWASLPDFQRTRGALRFLAVCLHTLKREGQARSLLGPGDVPIGDADVAHALFTEVGQREPFKAVLQRDFTGPNARVKRIDQRLAHEHPSLSGVCPAERIGTAILAYSFGGLLQSGEGEEEPSPTGVTESELLTAVIGPDLDSLTAQAVLKDLRDQCLFLHHDGVHYVFKTTPNVTQVLEDQLTHVKPAEVEQAIEDELRDRLAGRAAILWPQSSEAIPDREPRFLLAYLPLDFAMLGDAAQDQRAKELLTQHGETPRRYRNGLGLAVPESGQVEPLRRATRYLRAIERVRSKHKSFNLTTAQLKQLKEREQAEDTRLQSAIRNLYQTVWLPVMGEKGLEIDRVSLAGRPLAAHGIHGRLMELLTDVPPPRLFNSVTPEKIVELMRLEEGDEPTRVISTAQIVDSFYGIPGFPRLQGEAALRQAIAAGVENGVFGYIGPAGAAEAGRLKEDGSYLVSLETARIGTPLANVDLGNAFIVAPTAIEPETIEPPVPPCPELPGPGPQPPISPPFPPVETQTTVRLSMRMTRPQLYASFNAIGNLADEAGSVQMTVQAQKLDGFDPTWLRNAVLEPLDEADVELDE